MTFPCLGDNPAYAVALIPEALKENTNAVIRTHRHEFNVFSEREATEKIKGVITIFNDKTGYDALVIHYNQFKKIGKIKGKIFDADGTEIRKIEKEEIIDHQAYDGISIYSDARMKFIDFSYGVYPYTIEYEYEVKYNGLNIYPIWRSQNYKTGVEQSTFIMSLPAQMTFRYQAQNLANKPKESTKEGRHYSQWTVTQQKGILQEAYCPEGYQILPILITVPNDFYISGYGGNMKTWQSFGQFIYQLNEGRDQLSPAMQAKVKMMTANANSDAEKVAILYDYLKENMRYVSIQLGIGGWQTFDAQYVEKNKYGDCKALTYFMKAMLKSIDIPAYPALVNAGEQWLNIKEDFTTPYFNHIILKVLLDKPIWLECTSNQNPTGYLGSFTEARSVLLITENGGVLDATPPAKANAQISETTIVLTNKGTATVQSEMVFQGKDHERFRNIAVNKSKEEQEKWFLKNQSFSSPSIHRLQFTAADSLAEATCVYEIDLPRYATNAGKRLFVPLNSINPFRNFLAKKSNRIHPIAIPESYDEVDQIVFELPDNYQIENLPEPQTIDTPYGKYITTLEQKEQKIIYHRKLLIPAKEIPATDYQSLRDFFKAVSKQDSAQFVLVKKD